MLLVSKAQEAEIRSHVVSQSTGYVRKQEKKFPIAVILHFFLDFPKNSQCLSMCQKWHFMVK